MEENREALRPNWRFVVPVSIVPSAIIILLLWTTVQQADNGEIRAPDWIWLVIMLVGFWGTLAFGIARQIRISMSEENIQQLGLFGTKRICWEDVVRLRWGRGGLWVESSREKISLSPDFLRDFDAIEKLVRSRVHAHRREK